MAICLPQLIEDPAKRVIDHDAISSTCIRLQWNWELLVSTVHITWLNTVDKDTLQKAKSWPSGKVPLPVRLIDR